MFNYYLMWSSSLSLTIRFFSLSAMLLMAAGCVSSSYVASIGAQSIHGNALYSRGMTEYKVELKEATREVSSWGMAHGAFFPYTNLNPSRVGTSKGEVLIKASAIDWESVNEGTFELVVGSEKKQFKVLKYGDRAYFEHNYRYWYSYPSQLLLVATIPLDFVACVVAVPLFLVVAPFLSGESAKPNASKSE